MEAKVFFKIEIDGSELENFTYSSSLDEAIDTINYYIDDGEFDSNDKYCVNQYVLVDNKEYLIEKHKIV